MRHAVRAEWTKLVTLPGTPWLLVAIVASTVLVSAASSAAVTCPAGGCGIDPARASLAGIYLGQAVAAGIGVLAIGGEYSTGMIRTTFTALPRRATVLAAKAGVVAGPVLAAGALAVAGSLLAGRILLTGPGDAHLAPTAGPVLRAAAGSVLYLVLIALLGLGVATIVRDPAPAVGAVLGLLYLDPILAAAVPGQHLHHLVERYAPMTAGMTVQATTGLHDLPIGPWAGLGVLAAWSAAALVVGGLLLRLRDT
jgi:ABC-2 type transport system permease protein